MVVFFKLTEYLNSKNGKEYSLIEYSSTMLDSAVIICF